MDFFTSGNRTKSFFRSKKTFFRLETEKFQSSFSIRKARVISTKSFLTASDGLFHQWQSNQSLLRMPGHWTEKGFCTSRFPFKTRFLKCKELLQAGAKKKQYICFLRAAM